MPTYRTIKVTRHDGYATIEFTPPMLAHEKSDRPPRPGRHRELGIALEELRFDNEIRVIVITGQDDIFCMTAPNHPHFHGHTPGATWDGISDLPVDEATFQELVSDREPSVESAAAAAAPTPAAPKSGTN